MNCLVACDADWVPGIQASSESEKIDSFSMLPHPEVNGKVFLLGPQVNSANCNLAEDACSCCRERIVFINDSNFISISYCEDNQSYCKGNYRFYGPQVILNFSGKRIDHILQKDLIYKSADKKTLSQRQNQTQQWILVPFNCGSHQGLKNESESLFGFEDSLSCLAIENDIREKRIFDSFE
ncbi:MAG: hypothetical protein ACOVP1_12105 [Bacteroidia bacterium]